MRRLRGRKWLVSASSLVLVLALAAVAVAQTSDGTTSTTTVSGELGSELGLGGLGFGPPGGGPGRGMHPDIDSAEAQKARQYHEQQQEALLDLVREKMSADDQQAFDQLIEQQQAQQEQLEKDRQALQTTSESIKAIVDEALGVTEATISTTEGTSGGMGSPTADSGV